MPARPAYRQNISVPPHDWIHISRNRPRDVDFLRRFNFSEPDLRDTLPPLQRHKLVMRDEYVFMILLFPVFDRRSRTVSSAEIDFFIRPDLLITINDDSLPVVSQFFDNCKKSRSFRNAYFKGGITHLLFSLLEAQLDALFPMLVHVSNDIGTVEKQLFNADQRGVIMELLRIKTNIVNIRMAMQGHKRVIRSFLNEATELLPLPPKRQEDYEDLVERAKEIWDSVELQRDTINALHETHTSLLENRTNDIIKILTIFSVVIFPLTLVATMFAMDVDSVPFRDNPLGFVYVCAILVGIALLMLAFFRKRKWI